MKKDLHRIGVTAVLALVFSAGCAATDAAKPTHRWVSNDQASRNDYVADHRACSEDNLKADQRELDPNSAGYQRYVACMNARGYKLVAYDSHQRPQDQ